MKLKKRTAEDNTRRTPNILVASNDIFCVQGEADGKLDEWAEAVFRSTYFLLHISVYLGLSLLRETAKLLVMRLTAYS
jgi:hypothetical protein